MTQRLLFVAVVAAHFSLSLAVHASDANTRVDECRVLLTALRSEKLHPSSYYWEIDAPKSEALSMALSRAPSEEDIARFREYPARPVDPAMRAQIERERDEPRLLDHKQYIERHFSPRTFAYLNKHRDERIVIVPGDIDEVASYARGGGARRLEILPKNSLTDFTVMIASHREGHREIFIQILPGRSSTFEAVANLLHYHHVGGGEYAVGADRVLVTEPLHSTPTKIAQILLAKNAADIDAVFFGYSSNLTKVVTEIGGRTALEINEVDLFARVLELNGKKILSIPVTPYAFGDRAGDVLRGLNRALPRKRLVVTVGIAGTLSPEIDVDSYVVPDIFRRDSQGIMFSNLALNVDLPAHQRLQAESVDSILQETRHWLNRAQAAKSAIVEQEGFDLIRTAQILRYPLAAVYRVSDRVGFGFDDFNTIEFSYQPDEKLTKWQRAMVELLQQ